MHSHNPPVVGSIPTRPTRFACFASVVAGVAGFAASGHPPHWQIHGQEPGQRCERGLGMSAAAEPDRFGATWVSRVFLVRGGCPGWGGCRWICQCDSQFSSPLHGSSGDAAAANDGTRLLPVTPGGPRDR